MFGLDHAEWEVQSLSSYHTLSFFNTGEGHDVVLGVQYFLYMSENTMGGGWESLQMQFIVHCTVL